MIYTIIIALFLLVYLCCDCLIRFGIYNSHIIPLEKLKPFAIAGIMSGIATIAFSIVISLIVI